jgi:hypothetical protein
VTRRATRADGVFINCPFDADYLPLFEVIVFTVAACGFTPRCALEESDGGDVRIDKILRLLRACRYGIHDISRVELDADRNLPRFNMPFELGLDIGCRKFGGRACARKRILILDRERFRYQTFLSDIAGQDIRAHQGSVDITVTLIRHWLRTTSRRTSIPGDVFIRTEFSGFAAALPDMCTAGHLNRDDLSYADLLGFVQDWLEDAVRDP